MKVIDDAVHVSALAQALERLPDAFLPWPSHRFAAYPAGLIDACGPEYARLDVDACKAEMIRRALRVGRGFPRVSEAA